MGISMANAPEFLRFFPPNYTNIFHTYVWPIVFFSLWLTIFVWFYFVRIKTSIYVCLCICGVNTTMAKVKMHVFSRIKCYSCSLYFIYCTRLNTETPNFLFATQFHAAFSKWILCIATFTSKYSTIYIIVFFFSKFIPM